MLRCNKHASRPLSFIYIFHARPSPVPLLHVLVCITPIFTYVQVRGLLLSSRAIQTPTGQYTHRRLALSAPKEGLLLLSATRAWW